jgi:hypothetical protein
MLASDMPVRSRNARWWQRTKKAQMKKLLIPSGIFVAVLAVAAIMGNRDPASNPSIATLRTLPVKAQPVPSCSGNFPASPLGQPPPHSEANRHSVTLVWKSSSPASMSPKDAIKGYFVYRSQVSQAYTDGDRLNSLPLVGTRCSDATVQPRTTYYYVVKAVTESGVQSVVSKEIKAVIPFP